MTNSTILTRVFFAIDLPQYTKDAIENIILELKKFYPAKGVRWTQQHNLHITLQFLKEMNSIDLNRLNTEVRKITQNMLPFELSLGQVELFPTVKRPKVISLHVRPTEELRALVLAIGQGILSAGYPIEEQVFWGHVTLGRFNFGILKRPIILPKIEITPFTPELITEFVLSHSEPQPEGSRYTRLARFPLQHTS